MKIMEIIVRYDRGLIWLTADKTEKSGKTLICYKLGKKPLRTTSTGTKPLLLDG
jgi:hypothetical protein